MEFGIESYLDLRLLLPRKLQCSIVFTRFISKPVATRGTLQDMNLMAKG
jgi:hypothetical protein